MTCPRCRQRTEVVKTEPSPGGAKVRLRRCPQHGRFWTKAIEKVTEWVDEESLPATENPLPATLPVTAIAVRAQLAGRSDLISSSGSSLPDIRSVSVPSQGVTENHNPHADMGAEFVRQWEAQYGDKYPYERKDGVQLAAMVRKHPHLVERWPEMVARYLEDSWWGERRHPLVGLATNPVGFSGEKVVSGNGAPKAARNIAVAKGWSPQRRIG